MFNKTKLIMLLKSFSKTEIRKFRLFVISFYESDAGKVILLLEEVMKYYPEFENESFTKKNLFSKLYPKKKYNDATLRKLISYLTNLGEEFLIQQNLKKDKFAGSLFLLKELSSRNLVTVFEQQANLVKKEISKYHRNTDYYYYNFKFLNIINSFYAIRKRKMAVDNYQNEADSFFHYFFVEALSIYMYLINEKKISNRDFKLTLLNEVLNHLKLNNYTSITSIPIYYNCLMLMITNEISYFYTLREISKSLENEIHLEELKVIYIVMHNFCVAQVKKGLMKFKLEQFELQKESISRGLHLSEGRIHIFAFLNFVYEAVSVGETGWAEGFIKEKRKLIDPQYEFDAVNLSYAWCEFSKGEYEKALNLLGKINMEYIQFKLSVKTLQLMIYYELNLYDPAISLLDSYKHFILRDRMLPEVDKENRLNFAKYYKEILNLKNGTGDNTNLIKTDVKSTDNLVEKEWLLKKIDEIKRDVKA